MRAKAEITLNYRKGGSDDYKLVVIDFIPNSIRKMYLDLNDTIAQVQKDAINMTELQNNLIKCENKKEQKILMDKITLIHERIKRIGDSDFFKKRFELIVKILDKNNIKDDDLLDYDFWDDCVEPRDIINFINQAVSKDNETVKKKALKNFTKIG